MRVSSLSWGLRELAILLHDHAVIGSGLSPKACGNMARVLNQAARRSHELEGIAEDYEELDTELQAVALDLDRVAAPATAGGSFQAALKAQQFEIQRELDAGGSVHVARPGLAGLSCPIGDSNVVSFPVMPRPRDRHDGGDAA